MLRGTPFRRWLKLMGAVLASVSCTSASPTASVAAGGNAPVAAGAGPVMIEYIAHSCFRIHSPTGKRVLIDPFASRVWLGYDLPKGIAADAILITHPHFDHDGGEFMGREVPWSPPQRVIRDAGRYIIGDIQTLGVRGKHADPYGKEFGQKNVMWVLEVEGLRIVHLGDNGPLTEANIRELGRVDVLMMPIDSEYHILKQREIEAIRRALRPRVLIPMHYRHPDLEPSPDEPRDLGPIDPWLEGQESVERLDGHRADFAAASLPPDERIVVFHHSPEVRPPRP